MPITYVKRENDIVENEDDLGKAVINNLAIFLTDLPKKFIYDLQVVQSITMKDGTKVIGKANQVQTGVYSNGNPKYKTVVNKFVVADIYVVPEGSTKKKLTRLLIAPINIVSYQIQTGNLREFSEQIPALVQGQLLALGKLPTVAEDTEKGKYVVVSKRGLEFARNYAPLNSLVTIDEQQFVRKDTGIFRVSDGAEAVLTLPDTVPVVTPSANVPGKSGAEALTLLEWYSAQGLTLPSITDRAQLWQDFGFGPKGTYFGSGEQNYALLEKLKLK